MSVAAFVVGCSKEETASQQINKVQTETTQATADMKDYTFAQKDEFVKYMQGQLTALNLDLDKLSAALQADLALAFGFPAGTNAVLARDSCL